MTSLEWHGQLASIALRVPEVEQTACFYEDIVGMVRAPEPAGDRAGLGWGAGRPVLQLSAGAPALEHFALEIPDPSELEHPLTRLQGHGVDVRDLGEGVHMVPIPMGASCICTAAPAVPGSGSPTRACDPSVCSTSPSPPMP